MELILDKNYKITSDPKQYILMEKVNSKTEQDTFKSIGYYPSISSLLKAYKNLILRKSTLTTLEGLEKALEKLDKQMIKLGKEVEKNNKLEGRIYEENKVEDLKVESKAKTKSKVKAKIDTKPKEKAKPKAKTKTKEETKPKTKTKTKPKPKEKAK